MLYRRLMVYIAYIKSFKWPIFCVGLYINTFVFGMTFSFGALFNGLIDRYNEDVTMTAAVQAILIGVSQSTGIFSGVLYSRFGMWKVCFVGAIICPLGFILAYTAQTIVQLYIYISFMSGVGVSILFIGSTLAVGRTFSGSSRVLALAINNTGVSVGAAVIPYIMTYLLETYGVNGTFLIIGGFYLNCIPAARLLKLVDTFHDTNCTDGDTYETAQEKQTISVFESVIGNIKAEITLFQTKVRKVIRIQYVLCVLGVAMIMASFNGFFSLIVDIMKWKSFTGAKVLIVFPITQGLGIVGRLLPGIMQQIECVHLLLLPIIFGFCGFSGQLIIKQSSQFPFLLVGCGLAGIAIAGVMSCANIIVIQLVEKESVAIGLGLLYTTVGVLSAVAGPSYGAIKDSTDSYTIVLYLTAAFQMLGSVFFVITFFKLRSEQRQQPYKGQDNLAISIEEPTSK